MMRSVVLKQIAAEERTLGESLDYVRHILRTSFRAFLKFMLFMPLSRHRRVLPAAPYHVARIVATRDADCGTCVQIEVNLARRDGIPPETIRAVLDERPDALPDDLADAYRFTAGVVGATGDEDATRERIRQRYGEEGLVEIGLAIASARVFPITKRALGYARACALVDIKI
jgi:alkylhydroperoxidase family enzyme